VRVLVACEFSGVVRDAFLKRGHVAISCDILPSDKFEHHYQGDVMDIIHKDWDLIIAHPPCTYLCNSGVRWLYKGGAKKNGLNTDRIYEMCLAVRFFKEMLNAPAHRVCVENPIMHRYAKGDIGVEQTQIVHPWQFGHGEIKATGLWLKNLPPLVPTDIVEGREARIHKMPPSKDRGLLRSITYQGLADAMADQWGDL
jgi:hypothetical protein